MGISIFGIISIQLVWMKNAVNVKNELFIRGVDDALVKTSERLEKIQDLSLIHEMVFPDSLDQKNMNVDIDYIIDDVDGTGLISNEDDTIITKLGTPKIISLKKQKTGKIEKPLLISKKFIPEKGNAQIRMHFESDSDKNGTFTYKIEHFEDTTNNHVIVNTTSNGNIVLISSDSITTKVNSLVELKKLHVDSLLTKIDTTVVFFPDVRKKAKKRVWQIKETMNQFVTEIATFDLKKLDSKLIEKVLKEELTNRNIPIDFEYGIFVDTLLTHKSENIGVEQLQKSKLHTKLYTNDVIEKNIKLAVVFPKRDSFIYKSVSWLLIASLIFSLIILLTFALSIYYILNQKKISEMKSDFINNMTHEFKTPIATISVATDSISNDKVINNPDKIRYFTGMIKKENIRMNRQVEDILTIARFDKKDFEFKWEAINAHDIINDAIQGIVLQIEKRGGTIDTKLEAANPVVTTDKMHSTNIVYNLLDNANKYSPNTPEIKVNTKNKNNGLLIIVSDKGIGMTKAVQGRVFERFYRQTSGNIHNVKGFGLGLSYVKAVVEANKGTISVQSEPEKGSVFTVFLPFTRE